MFDHNNPETLSLHIPRCGPCNLIPILAGFHASSLCLQPGLIFVWERNLSHLELRPPSLNSYSSRLLILLILALEIWRYVWPAADTPDKYR